MRVRRRGTLKVTLHVDPLTIHSWPVLCRLSLLHAQGAIELRVGDLGYDDESYTLMLEVEDESHRSRVSLAVGDGGRDDSTARESMAHMVFRRSSSTGDGSLPLRMLLNARSGKEPIGRYLVSTLARAIRQRSLTKARRTVSALTRGDRFPLVEEYEEEPARRHSGGVFFQTRAWDPSHGSDPEDRESINDYRAELIRTLRSELGPRFTGGFVASDFARTRYPRLLTTGSAERAEYLNRIRSCDIGIASIGCTVLPRSRFPSTLPLVVQS